MTSKSTRTHHLVVIYDDFSPLTIYILPKLMPVKTLINDISLIILFLFVILLLLIYYKKINSEYIKKFLKLGAYLCAVFLPLIVLFDIVSLDIWVFEYFSYIDYATVFFIFWNIASILCFLQYFISYSMNSFIITPTDSYIKKNQTYHTGTGSFPSAN